jgi:hypothetical protein
MESLYLAAMVAVIVRAATQEEVGREAREQLELLQRANIPWFFRKLGYMLTCDFCMSFWVSLGVVGLWGHRLSSDDCYGYFLATFVTMAIANVYMNLYNLIKIDLKKEKAVARAVELRYDPPQGASPDAPCGLGRTDCGLHDARRAGSDGDRR